MRETISSKTGLSPPCCSANLSQSHSPPLFIHSLLCRFSSSLTEQCCSTHQEGCIPPSFFFLNCFSPSVSFPIPPLWLSPPSLYPSPSSFLLCASLPPSVSSGYMQQGTYSLGGKRDSAENCGGLKPRDGFGLKESETGAKDTLKGNERRRKG